MTRILPPASAATLLLVAACSPPVAEGPATEAQPEPAAAGVTALTGEALLEPELPDEFRTAQEALLATARQRHQADPENPETWIWVGRRTAYLGRYGEAIEVYSRALERFPDEPRLYRHRGHRYLTVRRLDAAIDDLSHAARLVAGRPDEVEPDGLPNPQGVPTSTLQSNIWYHLGLAHYLEGDFEAALAAYRQCLSVSRNHDMLTATSYWLYLTLRRLGAEDQAATVLAAIGPEMELLENHDYHRLLLSYRRLADAHEMWAEAEAEPDSVRYATVAYGLGAWHLVEGRPEKAREWFERARESSAWAAFGYLAAEAELARAAS